MNYDDANQWLKKRINLPTEKSSAQIASDIQPKARARSFFSARVGEARIVQRLRNLSDAVSGGEIDVATARARMKTWLKRQYPGKYDPEDGGISNLASTARLNLIFRQNAAMAAAVGRYQVSRDPDIELLWPCWRYLAGPNPRDGHAALDGRIYKKSDPIWKRIYPPWEFNCNCDVEDCAAPDDLRDSVPSDVPEDAGSGFAFDPSEAFDRDPPLDDPRLAAIVEERIARIPAPATAAGTPVSEALTVKASQKEVKSSIEHRKKRMNQKQTAWNRRVDGSGLPEPIRKELKTLKIDELSSLPKLTMDSPDFKNSAYAPRSNVLNFLHNASASDVAHELTHAWQSQAQKKNPKLAEEIREAQRKDWERLKKVWGAKVIDYDIESISTHKKLAKAFFGENDFENLSQVQNRTILKFLDASGSVSGGRVGGNHGISRKDNRDYFSKLDQEWPAQEALAQIRCEVKHGDERFGALFPELTKLLERHGLL